jgi:hypothetical protein
MRDGASDELPLEDWDDTADAWMNRVLLETDEEARVERRLERSSDAHCD